MIMFLLGMLVVWFVLPLPHLTVDPVEAVAVYKQRVRDGLVKRCGE